jgi:shikimate kinase
MTLSSEPGSLARIRRIVLTGFMGSGKSTAGPLLAARLGWRFVDADDVIEKEAGMRITEIFARDGEAAFRRRERDTITRLACGEGLVLALGGGAIEAAETRQILLHTPETLLVHLHVELATALARCGGTQQTRPVLADEANLAARYVRRLPLYRMAQVSIVTDGLTPEQVVEAAVEKLGNRGEESGIGAGRDRETGRLEIPGLKPLLNNPRADGTAGENYRFRLSISTERLAILDLLTFFHL